MAQDTQVDKAQYILLQSFRGDVERLQVQAVKLRDQPDLEHPQQELSWLAYAGLVSTLEEELVAIDETLRAVKSSWALTPSTE